MSLDVRWEDEILKQRRVQTHSTEMYKSLYAFMVIQILIFPNIF